MSKYVPLGQSLNQNKNNLFCRKVCPLFTVYSGLNIRTRLIRNPSINEKPHQIHILVQQSYQAIGLCFTKKRQHFITLLIIGFQWCLSQHWHMRWLSARQWNTSVHSMLRFWEKKAIFVRKNFSSFLFIMFHHITFTWLLHQTSLPLSIWNYNAPIHFGWKYNFVTKKKLQHFITLLIIWFQWWLSQHWHIT